MVAISGCRLLIPVLILLAGQLQTFGSTEANERSRIEVVDVNEDSSSAAVRRLLSKAVPQTPKPGPAAAPLRASASINSPCCCLPDTSQPGGQLCCCGADRSCCTAPPAKGTFCQNCNCTALLIGCILAGIATLAACLAATLMTSSRTVPATSSAGFRPFAGLRLIPAKRVPMQPVPVSKPAAGEEGTVRECPICLDEVVSNASWTVFPCQHGTCTDCYQRLMAGPHTSCFCPLCRLKLVEPVPEAGVKWEQVSLDGTIPGHGSRGAVQQQAFPASIVVIELPEPEPLEASDVTEVTSDPASTASSSEANGTAVGSKLLSTGRAVDVSGKVAGGTQDGGQNLGAGEPGECAGSFISTDSEDASESRVLIGSSRPQQS